MSPGPYERTGDCVGTGIDAVAGSFGWARTLVMQKKRWDVRA